MYLYSFQVCILSSVFNDILIVLENQRHLDLSVANQKTIVVDFAIMD